MLKIVITTDMPSGITDADEEVIHAINRVIQPLLKDVLKDFQNPQALVWRGDIFSQHAEMKNLLKDLLNTIGEPENLELYADYEEFETDGLFSAYILKKMKKLIEEQ